MKQIINKINDKVLCEAVTLGFETIFENNQFQGKELIVVDIQPEYKNYFSFNINDFTSFINENYDSFRKITFLYNGEDTLGMINQNDYIYWLLENGLEEDAIDSINFYDKGYNFFRNAMDQGIDHDEIAHLIAFMAKYHINDSREVDEEMWNGFLQAFPDDTEIVEYLKDNEDSINIPDLISELENCSNNLLVMGGGETECLAEVLIALKYLNKSYTLYNDFVY